MTLGILYLIHDFQVVLGQAHETVMFSFHPRSLNDTALSAIKPSKPLNKSKPHLQFTGEQFAEKHAFLLLFAFLFIS